MSIVQMSMRDSIPFDAIKQTRDGYVVSVPRVARTGIQIYDSADFGLVGGNEVRVWRPEAEVFKTDSLASYAHRPITLGHPPMGVSPENWSDVAVGVTGEEVVRDGDFVRVPIVLMDAKAMSALKSGIKEISMGYSCNVELVDGITPSGEAYNAIQRDLRMNHLAIVPAARGGSELKVGDNGEKLMADPVKTKVVLVDGLQVETTDAGAAAIEKLQSQLNDSKSAHDRELAARDAEITKLKGQLVSDEEMTKRVEARSKIVAVASAVVPGIVCDGKSNAEIRRAVVLAKCVGDASIADKTDDYIEARFDILVADATKQVKDPVRLAVLGGVQDSQGSAALTSDEAYRAAMVEMSNAWKMPGLNEKGN